MKCGKLSAKNIVSSPYAINVFKRSWGQPFQLTTIQKISDTNICIPLLNNGQADGVAAPTGRYYSLRRQTTKVYENLIVIMFVNM